MHNVWGQQRHHVFRILVAAGPDVRRSFVAPSSGTTIRPSDAMFLPTLFEANLEEFPQAGLPRLRFVACRLERAAAAMTRVTVELDGPVSGQRINTRAEGSTCVGGDMRLAAVAMLDALTVATKGVLKFDLIGVKPIRAFDTNVVVAAVMAHGEGMSRRLVGTAIVDEDAITGAALAALNATNRLVSPLLAQGTQTQQA